MPSAASTVKPRPETNVRGNFLGPPVRTLTQSAFDAACAQLMRIVEADFAPRLMIGIRTGGLVVAQSMVLAVLGEPPLVVPVTCRRPSTARKVRLPLFRATLARVPRSIVDVLRQFEHRWFIAPAARRSPSRLIDPADTKAATAAIGAMSEPSRILVVDDAVDSGATLLTVLDLLREACPRSAVIRSAAITQTLDDPLVRPDYVLFRGTLCRFPWSFDAAG
jgi:uncharacterized protein